MQRTAIVVPCYNESGRLRTNEFADILRKLPYLDLIFVNDGSRDNTHAIITSLCAAHPDRIHIIDLQRNQGKGEAVRRGVLRAFQLDYVYVGYWDADISTPLHTIEKFVATLDEQNMLMIIGSRVRLLGRRIERNAIRHYLGRVFATAVSLLLKRPLYDTQCGAKLFRNCESLRVVFRDPFITTWIFDVEMLARILIESEDSANRIVEYPLEEWKAVASSRMRLAAFLLAPVDLLRLFARYYWRIPSVRLSER